MGCYQRFSGVSHDKHRLLVDTPDKPADDGVSRFYSTVFSVVWSVSIVGHVFAVAENH